MKTQNGKTNLLGRFSIKTKLFFIVIVAAVTPVILGAIMVTRSYSETSRLEKLSRGLKMQAVMRDLRIMVADHRQAWKTYQKGIIPKETLDAFDAKVEEVVENFDQLNETFGKEMALYEEAKKVKTSWRAILELKKTIAVGQDVTGNTGHTDLIKRTAALSHSLLLSAGMILDTDPKTQYLNFALTVELPTLIRSTNEARYLGTMILIDKKLTQKFAKKLIN